MIHSPNQRLNHSFHFQSEEQRAHAVYRNIGFYYQRVDVQVPNPVKLIPYRTFAEIEQPSSLYVFRVRDDGNGAPAFKLVEADNGLWKHAAMLKIKDYFECELADAYKENLTIIA